MKTLTPIEACDMAIMEAAMGGDGEDDLQVTFGVKELLVDIRAAIDRSHDATKAELEAVERRVTDRIVLVDAAAKDREDANAKEIAAVKAKVDDLGLWRARVAGAAAVAGVLGGGLGATFMKVLGG